jgi:hypothetical protein
MRHRVRSGWLKHTAVAAAAVLASLGAPRAAETLILADGSVLGVWEARGRADRLTGGGSVLAWSLGDARGTRGGVVGATVDRAVDTDARLAVDPATGTIFLLWSRADGGAFKIHYARFEAGGWVDAHALTFGPGNDRHPRAGFDRTGATLFFAGTGARYFHAPFDAAAGRLFAAPRALALLGGSDGAVVGDDGDLFVNGGLDAPVPPTDRACVNGCSAAGAWGPASTSPEGNVDAPIPPTTQGGGKPTGNGSKASAWGVAGDGVCGSQVLVIPSRDLRNASVIRFTGGEARVLARVPVSAPVARDFGDQTARAWLPLVCW